MSSAKSCRKNSSFMRFLLIVKMLNHSLRPTDWGDIWPELINAEHPWPPVVTAPKEAA